MWHAPASRDLIIQGKFKKLFLEGVYEAIDNWLELGYCKWGGGDGEDISTKDDVCSAPYDKFSNKKKLYAIAEITRCLTTNCEPPELFQWNESSVYAVFEMISCAVESEIDMMSYYEEAIKKGELEEGLQYRMRKIVSEAEREQFPDEEEENYIDPKCDNIEDWSYVILGPLAETILWDDDFLNRSSNEYKTPMPKITGDMMTRAKRFLLDELPKRE